MGVGSAYIGLHDPKINTDPETGIKYRPDQLNRYTDQKYRPV